MQAACVGVLVVRGRVRVYNTHYDVLVYSLHGYISQCVCVYLYVYRCIAIYIYTGRERLYVLCVVLWDARVCPVFYSIYIQDAYGIIIAITCI